MKEYIERAVALEILKRNPIGTWRGAPVYSEEIKSAADEIGDLPAADVAEVRHGRWIVHFDHFAPYQKCSVCGFEIPLVATENEVEMCFYKHCPECTARMDKEAEHETS